MSHDDDDLDDKSLAPLRSVWLAMPDEDPPSRGLDALLAAARVKADEMKASGAVSEQVVASEPGSVPARTVDDEQPSLWQRLLALFQRPQMLALATIMLLVGGAVVISQRRDKLDASHEATAPQMSDGKRNQEIAFESKPAMQSAPGAGSASATPGATPVLGDVATGADTSAVAAPEMPKRDEAVVRKSPPRAKGGTATADTRTATAGKATTTAKPKVTKSAGGAGGGAAMPSDDAFEMSLSQDETLKGAATAPVEATKAEGGEPTVKQLHARARTAAAKNDCATVRALAKQIARQDAAYYRANIAPDTTLAGCLN